MIQFVVMAAVNPKWASICFSIWITARFFYATGPSLKSWWLIRMTHTIRQAGTLVRLWLRHAMSHKLWLITNFITRVKDITLVIQKREWEESLDTLDSLECSFSIFIPDINLFLTKLPSDNLSWIMMSHELQHRRNIALQWTLICFISSISYSRRYLHSDLYSFLIL